MLIGGCAVVAVIAVVFVMLGVIFVSMGLKGDGPLGMLAPDTRTETAQPTRISTATDLPMDLVSAVSTVTEVNTATHTPEPTATLTVPLTETVSPTPTDNLYRYMELTFDPDQWELGWDGIQDILVSKVDSAAVLLNGLWERGWNSSGKAKPRQRSKGRPGM